MKHVVLAHLKSESAAARKGLRLKHLQYMERHKSSIVAGGPYLSGQGVPLTMVLLTQFTDVAEAQAFMTDEPYNASGQVFEFVEIHPWSQVLPENSKGELADEIDREQVTEPNLLST